MIHVSKRHHSFTVKQDAMPSQKVSELIKLVVIHGLDLSNEEPFSSHVSKQAKNRFKTMYEHALSCAGSQSALQDEVVQAVAAITKRAPRLYPSSVEQEGDWLKAINAAALKLGNHQLHVIANAWTESEDWKCTCAKKNPKANPQSRDPFPTLRQHAVGSVYAKITKPPIEKH
jgi:hypothetical protein